MNNRQSIFVFLSILCLLCAYSSCFIIKEGYRAIVLQFGEVITEESLKPGLHFKLPFVQKHITVDSRILNLSSDSREVIASDQKRLIVNYYAKYLIENPAQFYRSVRTIAGLENRLRPIIESNMREQIGLVPLSSLLTEERSRVMSGIKKESDLEAKNFGVKVVDVRIKRTDLPEENSSAIFRRMQTAREKEAKEIRAQGYQDAQTIISRADKERRIILAEAYRKSQEIKGEGDAIASKIYNEAYSVDRDFFNFYRTIIAYEKSLKSKNSRFILKTEDKFFDVLKGND